MQTDPPGAAQPTALSATLHLPQHNDRFNGLVTAQLKKAVVKLPQGVASTPRRQTVSACCSEAQFGLHANEPAHCPDASKIGTAKITTPLLEDPLEGPLYLAQQNANPFGSLLAAYVVAEGHGVILKQAAKLDLNRTPARSPPASKTSHSCRSATSSWASSAARAGCWSTRVTAAITPTRVPSRPGLAAP